MVERKDIFQGVGGLATT